MVYKYFYYEKTENDLLFLKLFFKSSYSINLSLSDEILSFSNHFISVKKILSDYYLKKDLNLLNKLFNNFHEQRTYNKSLQFLINVPESEGLNRMNLFVILKLLDKLSSNSLYNKSFIKFLSLNLYRIFLRNDRLNKLLILIIPLFVIFREGIMMFYIYQIYSLKWF